MSVSFLFVHVNEWASVDSPDTLPISLGYSAAALSRHGFSSRILGCYQDRPLTGNAFREALLETHPTVTGFSMYEANIATVRVLARFAKTVLPETLVVVGGPQVTFMPARGLVQMPEIDILCRGEGEVVLPSLACSLARGQGLETVPGICFRAKGEARETGRGPLVTDLDEYPSPYTSDIIDPTGKKRVILLTSRGCTSPCTFCYTTRANDCRVRFHSVDRVVSEIRHLREKGIDDFWFADPNFAHSRKRLTALLKEIRDQTPGIRFWCQTRYNLIDGELLGLLKEAGAHTIAFGLESVDPVVLRKIKKNLDPEKLAGVIAMVQEAGIEVELFTLFGLPGETLDRSMATLDYVRENRVRVEGNSISQQLHLFHGTPISQEPGAHGVKPVSMTKPAYYSICRDYETESMTRDEIETQALFWRLNRSDFTEAVRAGTNLFEPAGFISRNRERLWGRPDADLMMARIYLALEEFAAAAQCLERLERDFGDVPRVREFLGGPVVGYRLKRRATAQPGSTVIFDCRGVVEGRVVPATESSFQDARLDNSTLLPDFEKSLYGLAAGRCTECEVRFPPEYSNPDLAGKAAFFQIYLQQVLEPVATSSPWELIRQAPRNVYRLHDLEVLRKRNEKLYYFALRDHSMRGLVQDMTNYLSLLNFYLRLGFFDKAMEMVALLPQDRSLHGHAGRILLINGLAKEALPLLEQAPDQDGDAAHNRAKALIQLGRYLEAEQLLREPIFSKTAQGLDLRVGVSSLLNMPEGAYLERMDDLIDFQIRALAEA